MGRWVQWKSNPNVASRPGVFVRAYDNVGVIELRKEPRLRSESVFYDRGTFLGIVIAAVKHVPPDDDFTSRWALVFVSNHYLGWVPTYNLEEYLESDVLDE